MWDVLLRGLFSPLDYIKVLYTRTLVLKEIIQESEHTYSFLFTPQKPFIWRSGEHGIFYFPGKKIQGKSWRAFSIASSAHEEVIRVSTIITDDRSDFKHKMREMKPGDTIRIHGPFGEFHTHTRTKKIIGIAGGIGITPFRALLFDIAHGHIRDTEITLIYAAPNNNYTFKKELDQWATQPNITIHYVATPDEVNAALDTEIHIHGNNAEYFISGSPGMIGALRDRCKEKGIKRIVNDPFKGY